MTTTTRIVLALALVVALALQAVVATPQERGRRVDLETLFSSDEARELIERRDNQRRKLLQEGGGIGSFLAAPVGLVTGAICGAVPRGVYEERFGLPWWAPLGVAQGICSTTMTGSITSSI